MHIDILTIFPEMVEPVLSASMLGKAAERDILDINTVNIRDFTTNKHKKTDDTPFGGGAGMVMMAQPVFDALRHVEADKKRIIYMSPRGRLLDKELALELSREENLVFLCGHYEGIDERIMVRWQPEEISIGDYILTGGELAAMVTIDTIARFLPDVLGNGESAMEESIYSGLIEYPHYTRPREYEGMSVPEVLVSGNHELIHLWKFEQACRLTKDRRPDLWTGFTMDISGLSRDEKRIVEMIITEQQVNDI